MTENQPTEPQDEPSESADEAIAADAKGESVGKLAAQRDDLLARLQRVSADYMNYQKRVHRDVEQAREYANEALIRALLPVLDDMERAMEHAKANHDANDALLQGMGLVLEKALATLTQFGVTVVAPQGEPFDPQLHLALMQEPTSDVPPMTVLKVLAKGYQLKGRIIRPAQVVVSKAPE